MPRQRRLNYPGALFHVIGRGIERRRIFLDDNDRVEFLVRLKLVLDKTGYQCYAWALMPNHFHILVRSSDSSLDKPMRGLLSGYAGYYNRRHSRVGHVFQNRYKSILCQEDTYLLELIRYIHLNSLRTKLVNGIKSLINYQKNLSYLFHKSLRFDKERESQ